MKWNKFYPGNVNIFKGTHNYTANISNVKTTGIQEKTVETIKTFISYNLNCVKNAIK